MKLYKVLFLDTLQTKDGLFNHLERNKVRGVDSRNLLKDNSFVSKLLVGLGYYLYAPILYLVYGSWKNNLDYYDVFILSSRRASKYAVQYLSRKTNKRVIVWYWNIVTKEELLPSFCKRHGCEVWSFDQADCKRYGMKFGDAYYFNLKNGNTEKGSGLFYVGIEKQGRAALLKALSIYLKKRDVLYDFNLVRNLKCNCSTIYPYAKFLSYEEVLKKIESSSAILDLTQPTQTGLTLRPIEALVYQKKLVTNNQNVRNSKAYSSKNTYIIEDDKFDRLDLFLREKFLVDESVSVERYLFENWLKRICDGVEAQI